VPTHLRESNPTVTEESQSDSESDSTEEFNLQDMSDDDFSATKMFHASSESETSPEHLDSLLIDPQTSKESFRPWTPSNFTIARKSSIVLDPTVEEPYHNSKNIESFGPIVSQTIGFDAFSVQEILDPDTMFMDFVPTYDNLPFDPTFPSEALGSPHTNLSSIPRTPSSCQNSTVHYYLTYHREKIKSWHYYSYYDYNELFSKGLLAMAEESDALQLGMVAFSILHFAIQHTSTVKLLAFWFYSLALRELGALINKASLDTREAQLAMACAMQLSTFDVHPLSNSLMSAPCQ